jgi:glycosyltransferase involved in cell wall biosynthesis
MRVALLTFNAQAGDAIGNQVAEKLAFFLERGADVRVFVESDARLHPFVQPYCQLLSGPEPQGEGWQFLASADLVIVEYGQYYPSLGLLPLLAGRKPRILFDYHGITPLGLWGKHHREALEKGAQYRGLVWCADAAVAHSRFTWRELHDHTRFLIDKIHILSHPLDTTRFAPVTPGRPLCDALGLGAASLLLFVGRLAPNKRVPLLVEALGRLRDLEPPVHLVIVGDTSDLYQMEAAKCRQRAEELSLAGRLHFLGHVGEEQLLDTYRSADVFVMPSRHEGFCIPLMEAMACGVPVVAARAGALPETIAGAGLTFTADDADDLARQIRRVLTSKGKDERVRANSRRTLRVAVVSFRYGTDFVGGAETSLRKIATALHEAGHQVEVFTTCTTSEGDWANHVAEGTTTVLGIPVHRFRLDPHDRTQHVESVRSILHANGPVQEEVERDYLAHSIHSTRLLGALRQQIDQFDAVLVGPYLFGLTYDVAQAFPEKMVLVPCFHDEPFAHLRLWHAAYRHVGGILYHSPEEQDLAEVELGLNHPGAVCVGTFLDTELLGDAERGRALVGTGHPYLVYCGRYSVQKNVPRLLDYARHYQELHPERYTFVFLGEGEVAISREPWARDLGFVDEDSKRDLLAGAATLIQLSCYESLSLVALESWAQGTPLIADPGCKVLVGHLGRSGGGRAAGDFESFTAALDDLWERPHHWQKLGQQGRAYVQEAFGSRDAFTQRLEEALHGLSLPLVERMRQQGRRRAAEFDRARWRERFGKLVEELLDTTPRPHRQDVVVRPRTTTRTVSLGLDTALVPSRVINRGSHAVLHEGPGRVVVRCDVRDESRQLCNLPAVETPLPGLLLPGQKVAAAVRVPVPAVAGVYRIAMRVEYTRVDEYGPREATCLPSSTDPESSLRLIVENSQEPAEGHCCTDLLQAVQAALVEADRQQRLPDDYIDVTQGFLADWKRRLKRKLLGNFKLAYVDVLSRQQSAFNRHILSALHEMAECVALLDHARKPQTGPAYQSEATALAAAIERAVGAGKADELAVLLQNLIDQLAESRQRYAALEERLIRLEKSERV